MGLPQTPHSVARTQMLAALLPLFVMSSILGALALLTRNAALENWLETKREEAFRQTRQVYIRTGYFQSPHDLWLCDELPKADFSKGSVCFVGASDVEASTKQWELPPDVAALVHNYGIGACNHEGDLALLRYLIEDRGLLKAGGEKNLVVIGATYETTCAAGKSFHNTFTNALEIHHLYDFDDQHRIHDVRINPILKFLDFEQTRQVMFLTRFSEVMSHQFNRWRHHGIEPPRIHDRAAYVQRRQDEMGPDWRKKIDDSSPVFRELINYLRARHVQIRVILMAQGSWNNSLPYNQEYKRQISAICAEEHIPVTDWSGLLEDEDFGDSTHPNLFGAAKTHPAFLQIALPFLRSTRALPDNPPSEIHAGR